MSDDSNVIPMRRRGSPNPPPLAPPVSAVEEEIRVLAYAAGLILVSGGLRVVGLERHPSGTVLASAAVASDKAGSHKVWFVAPDQWNCSCKLGDAGARSCPHTLALERVIHVGNS